MSAWWPRSASVPRRTTRVAADDRGRPRGARPAARLAVAGFAAANVMLLSVAVWSGHDGSMGDATRTLFHWLSAADRPAGDRLCRPAVLPLGLRGAARPGAPTWTCRSRSASSLACVVSLHETWVGEQHAYFDSAITLLFFLLIGRYLDRRARGRARHAVRALLALVEPQRHGRRRRRHARACGGSTACVPGDMLLVAAGERARRRRRGERRQLDARRSLVTGESVPRPVERRRQGLRRHGQSRRAAARAGHRRRRGHAAGRDRAPDRGGRARPVALRRARRPRGPRLRAGRARHGAAHLPRLDAAGRARLGPRAADRDRRADHHLPLRAGARRAGGPGGGQHAAVAQRHPAALADRAGAPGRSRPCRVRQDRHPDARPAGAGRGRRRRRGAAGSPPRSPPTRAIRWRRRWSAPRPTRRRPRTSSSIPARACSRATSRLGSARFCGVADALDDGRSELWLAGPGRPARRFAFADRLRPDAAGRDRCPAARAASRSSCCPAIARPRSPARPPRPA